MGKCDKILAKANASNSSLTFAEICKLAECYGWEFRRISGSHHHYSNKELAITQGHYMNFQPDKTGKAKAYQVRQLLDAIENLPNTGEIK